MSEINVVAGFMFTLGLWFGIFVEHKIGVVENLVWVLRAVKELVVDTFNAGVDFVKRGFKTLRLR